MRTRVRHFAEEMERVLQSHDDTKGKHGWTGCNPLDLLVSLRKEVCELEQALLHGDPPASILHEAVDVANFAMMIADVSCGNSCPRCFEPMMVVVDDNEFRCSKCDYVCEVPF